MPALNCSRAKEERGRSARKSTDRLSVAALLIGWRSGGRVPERVEDGVRHQGALDVRADRRAMIARLKAVPAELRMISTLDPDPPSGRGQFATVGLDLLGTGETITRAHDFRDRDPQRTQIDIAGVRAADQHESRESDTMLTRQRRSDDRASRMPGDHPAPWSVWVTEEAIESPLELRRVCAVEGATPRELDEIRREAGACGGVKEWGVRDRIDQRTGKEDERWSIGRRRRCRDEKPDTIPVLYRHSGIGPNRDSCGRGCPKGNERPAHKDDGEGEAECYPDPSNASPDAS
jgi:hypothetical protein